MSKKIIFYIALLFVSLPVSGFAATPSPAGAKEMILSPADGATVTSPVTVKFGIKGMTIVPAGTDKVGLVKLPSCILIDPIRNWIGRTKYR